MSSSQSSWDERYQQKTAPSEPTRLVVEFAALLPFGALALDLACGGGRNSVFLAKHGLRVVGVDRSRNALEQGRALAARHGVNVAWLQADLEGLQFPEAVFDVILGFYYRDPALYLRLRAWMRPGGLLFYQTYRRAQLPSVGGPHNPAHLLEPGELFSAFQDWDLILSRESEAERTIASLVARKPSYTGRRFS